MSVTVASLRKTIAGAQDLRSVVRTMKALAAASISQYEQAVVALDGYYRTVQLGLGVCLRSQHASATATDTGHGAKAIVIFGSDQGLVGRFNDVVADKAITMLAGTIGTRVWVVGERVKDPLTDAGLDMAGLLAVPLSIDAIVPLVAQILSLYEASLSRGEVSELHLVYNKPSTSSVYEPVSEKLLPLDGSWGDDLRQTGWLGNSLPEVIGPVDPTLSGFLSEFLFVSLFRACAASLASENASRLAAMQRADKNIDSMLDDLNAKSRRLRQDQIDEELFDLVSGYEALGR